MKARIDKLADWGCDWVEFDNMDWFFYDEVINQYGIVATEDRIVFYQGLCT